MFKFRKVKSSVFPLVSTFPERLLCRHRYSKRKSICLNLRFDNFALGNGPSPQGTTKQSFVQSNAPHESKCIHSSMRLSIQKPATVYSKVDAKQSFVKGYEKHAQEIVDPGEYDQLVISRDRSYWNLCRSTVRAKLSFVQTLQGARTVSKKGAHVREKQNTYTTRKERRTQYIEENTQSQLQDFSLKNREKFNPSAHVATSFLRAEGDPQDFVKTSVSHDKPDLYDLQVQKIHSPGTHSAKAHKQERINRLYWHVDILSNGLLRSASRFR